MKNNILILSKTFYQCLFVLALFLRSVLNRYGLCEFLLGYLPYCFLDSHIYLCISILFVLKMLSLFLISAVLVFFISKVNSTCVLNSLELYR